VNLGESDNVRSMARLMSFGAPHPDFKDVAVIKSLLAKLTETGGQQETLVDQEGET
jgi:hypothetical protein